MLENPFYTQELQECSLYNLGDFSLEHSNKTLHNCKLAYRTFGHLSPAKDNAILIPTWFAGTGKIIQQVYIGPSHALSPEKYFIIIVDQLAGGLSSSPHNTSPPHDMANFPHIHIIDDVRAQHRLVTELFAIDRLALVFGASMGAQQVYEWCVRYGLMVSRAAVLAGTAKISFHQMVFTRCLQQAVVSDPAWRDGKYTNGADVSAGLERMADILAIIAWSTEFYQQRIWKTDLAMHSVDETIYAALTKWFLQMDPNALLWQIWKWRHSDVSHGRGGDVSRTLAGIKAKMLVLAISHDMFVPPREMQQDQKSIPNSDFRIVQSKHGHGAINGMDPAFMVQVDRYLNELLSVPVQGP